MIYLTKGGEKFRTVQEHGAWIWKVINDREHREHHGPFHSEVAAADNAIDYFHDTTVCLTPNRPEDSA